MARIGINYQDVAAAAATVQGHQQIPTVDRVREVLKTGSKSTIARHLKEWKIRTEQIADDGSLPAELTALVNGLWERLQQAAEDKITQFEAAANQEIDAAQQALADEQKSHAAIANIKRQQDEQLYEQANTMQMLRAHLEEEKRSNATLTERNHALSQQVENQKSESQRLHQLLSSLQTNLEHYQKMVQKLREEHALAIQNQRKEYEKEIETVNQQLIASDKQKLVFQQERDAAKTELAVLTRQCQGYEEEKIRLQQQLQEMIIQETRLQHQCNDLNKKNEEYKNINTKISTELHEGEKKIVVFIEQITRMNESLSEAQDNIRLLRNEKYLLAQEKAHLEGQFKQMQSK